MINRSDFDGKSYQEMMTAMEQELVVYHEFINGLTTLDACVEEEQKLMGYMNEVDAHLSQVTYTLADGVDFENMYELVALWKGDNFTQIPYRAYDSTLRCLNQVSFKGMQEWTDILAVNEYLSIAHNEYSLDTGMLIFYSECHNALMDRMKELNPAADVPESLEE